MMTLARRTRAVALGALCAMALGAGAWMAAFDPACLALPASTLYVDRSGQPLRHVPDARGERHVFVPLSGIPELVRHAFMASEDERFMSHPGFDLAGMARALQDNIREGRIVSGASTITQQVVRLIDRGAGNPKRARSYTAKAAEVLRAFRLEAHTSKQTVLEQYLNRVPLGNNIAGVGLAARVYFGRGLMDLTPAEAATLAALPKAPGAMAPPTGDMERLRARRDWVLGRMADAGWLDPESARQATREDLAFRIEEFPFEAPHVVDMLEQEAPWGAARPDSVQTSIDLSLQREAEATLASHAGRLRHRGARQAALMVVHNRTSEVLAAAGSLAYGPRDGGYNNGFRALRSAGSTLKPLLYALAIESGFPTSMVLGDVEHTYRSPGGDYVPLNFDRREYGPVTIRSALGNSLNLSAVRMLELLGHERFHALLASIGLINHPELGAEHYGLGLVIGNPEVSLEELAAAYAMLANGGVYRPVAFRAHARPEGTRVFSEAAAYIITDILSDASARMLSFGSAGAMQFPYQVAIKTGTSTKYRDAWAVAYTADYTVAAWVGNFEGDPTYGLAGASGAAPLVKDMMDTLYRSKTPPMIERPAGVAEARVCGLSGKRPGPHCTHVTTELFLAEDGATAGPLELCDWHTGEPDRHELPAVYARWIRDKGLEGTEGAYRMRGGDAFDTEAEQAMRMRDVSLPPTVRQQGATGTVEAWAAPAPERAPVPLASGRASIGADARAPMGQATGGGGALIAYPLDGDRFVLGARAPEGSPFEAIRLDAVVHEAEEFVDWYVDGEHHARATAPYDVYWRLRKGQHTITVATPSMCGDSVTISVE